MNHDVRQLETGLNQAVLSEFHLRYGAGFIALLDHPVSGLDFRKNRWKPETGKQSNAFLQLLPERGPTYNPRHESS
jgi:hypothetical protein